MQSFKVGLFFIVLVLLFQNCSQGEGSRSRQYVVKKENKSNFLIVDEEINDDVSHVPENGGLGAGGDPADPYSMLDAKVCFQEYISVFPWGNENANLMNERPLVGSSKFATMRLFKNVVNSSSTTNGWSVEGMLKINNDGSTSSSVKFIKAIATSPDSLDCFLMRVGANDSATLEEGLANTLFQNIGTDLSANILVGFLRHEQQFIACRVSSGQGIVHLKGYEQEDVDLNSSQAFILKRGCYPSSSLPVD